MYRLIIVILLILGTSCSQNSKRRRALQIFNEVQSKESSYRNFGLTIKDSIFIKGCIYKLGEAIKLDNSNSLFYSKQVKFYLTLKDTDGAIFTLKESIKNKPHYAEGMTGLGFLYEKIGDLENANQYYFMALKEYNSRKKLTFNDQINRALIVLLTSNKNEAINELQKIKTKNDHQISVIQFWKDQISAFDRTKFIDKALE